MGLHNIPVFFQMVKLDKSFSVTMVKMLRHQRRLNRDAVERRLEEEISDEHFVQLEAASRSIDSLSEKIMDVHKPRMFLGDNLVKGGGALVAALFTAVLRQALSGRMK